MTTAAGRSGAVATTLQLALLIGIWGTTYAAIRVGLESIPPFLGIAVRFAVASALLFLGCAVLGIRWWQDGTPWGMWTFNAVAHFVVPYGVVYWCEQWIPSGLAAVLFTTFPLFVAVLAHWLVPGERLRPLAVLGLVLGAMGVAILYADDLTATLGPEGRRAAWIFLLSPLTAALGDVVIKRWYSQIHPVSLTAPSLALTAITCGVLSFAFESPLEVTWTPTAWGVTLYLAVFGTALAFVLYFGLLSRVTVTSLSLITFGIPIVAMMVGAVVLDESLTPRLALGAAFILAGVWAALRRSGG